ncbi:uncharacterized protein BDR25DRAFT_358244 [Lindgomyces ingoldianus]|uniref:Uncharacterized protein n=1 Tax=Lindgomyces ingoldianus TaxID=673940 RepID=A0ACB6QPE9_9PLEO|nr:uncharacterized protein BDR25DRAFT_358244 [Lindgomyces ingoldianus]KAF2467990.1 hypothetical protein BDR25DRAFT_358244 [Lindgomyces ingoldianus]
MSFVFRVSRPPPKSPTVFPIGYFAPGVPLKGTPCEKFSHVEVIMLAHPPRLNRGAISSQHESLSYERPRPIVGKACPSSAPPAPPPPIQRPRRKSRRHVRPTINPSIAIVSLLAGSKAAFIGPPRAASTTKPPKPKYRNYSRIEHDDGKKRNGVKGALCWEKKNVYRKRTLVAVPPEEGRTGPEGAPTPELLRETDGETRLPEDPGRLLLRGLVSALRKASTNKSDLETESNAILNKRKLA